MDKLHQLVKTLNIKNTKLFSLTKNHIKLDNIDVTPKIFKNDNVTLENYNLKQIKAFLDDIKPIRLNHIGIGYDVPDMDVEMKKIKKQLKHKLYREPTSHKKARWLFAGNVGTKPITPLFELVFYETKNPNPTKWRPQFQIDYDTSHTPEELVKLSHKHFNRDIFTWRLNIKPDGIVLMMGDICKIGDVKINIGLGTINRDTVYHRNELAENPI
jgi:hypothetical protein